MLILRWLLPWCCVLLTVWTAGIAAAQVIGERICCRTVAFTALNGFVYDVYTLDRATGIAYNLTARPVSPNRDGDYLAGWSPDGTLLAFTSERGTKTGLYVMDAGGRNVRRLPDDCLSQVSWSPDGTYLLCLPPTVGDYDFPDAYVIPVDGRPARRLNQLPGKGTRFAAASPDGAQIVYDESDASGTLLYTVDADGNYRQPLAEADSLNALVWLNNGTIGYIGQCDGTMAVVMLTTDTSPRCLSITPVIRPRYAWSPDGTLLAYSAMCSGHDRLAVLNLQTGASTCIEAGKDLNSNMAWSPDGNTLAWGTHFYADDSTQVWLYDRVTQNARIVVDAHRYEGVVGVRWSPDGSALSFAVLTRTGGTDGTFVLDMATGELIDLLPGTTLQTSPFAWQPER